MNTVFTGKEIPKNSRILNNFDRFNYFDSYHITKDTEDSIDTIVTSIFRTPAWISILMKLRDSLVSIFGLQKGRKAEHNISEKYAIGSKAVFFTVVDRNKSEIVMAENDKHLNFQTSVLIERKKPLSTIHLITIVKYNNIWGRLYFFLVKPFHQLIIKSLLKRIAR